MDLPPLYHFRLMHLRPFYAYCLYLHPIPSTSVLLVHCLDVQHAWHWPLKLVAYQVWSQISIANRRAVCDQKVDTALNAILVFLLPDPTDVLLGWRFSVGVIVSIFDDLDRYLLNGVNLKMKFHRSKNSFCLLTPTPANNYRVKIVDAALYVRKVVVSSQVALSHAKMLHTVTAKYPLRRVGVKTFFHS